jgi:glycosyltransferase involved in cell wall biosynthesis
MPRLSAVIITLNEEKNIGRCLASLRGVADEIVVVDSGSTDQTADLCRNFGAKFVMEKWRGYGGQKNFANALATGDWILSLDADEALSPKLQAEIIVTLARPAADIYAVNRLTHFCGKWTRHCGWYPDPKIRLWKNGAAKWDTAPVHEGLDLPAGAAVKHLAGDLWHYTCDNLVESVAVANRYSTLGAQALAARGHSASLAKVGLAPAWSFFQHYVLRRGFLDGYHGWLISAMAAFSTFLKYAKLREINAGQSVSSRQEVVSG